MYELLTKNKALSVPSRKSEAFLHRARHYFAFLCLY